MDRARVYKRSYLYQQIWYKLRLICAIRNAVYKCKKGKVSLGLSMAAVYALDIAVGVIMVNSALLFVHPNDLVQYTTWYIHSVLEWMKVTLQWFMNDPIGLKLNYQLTGFLCKMFIDLLSLWTFFYSVILVQYLHLFFHFVLYSQFFGITIVLAILLHFFKFLNFWLIWFYVFCHFVTKLHVTVLLSLFRLFTVRKWNPLRKRIDSCTYDPKQLLLGTLFFISLLFLLPTVLVFYVLFLFLKIANFLLSSIVRCFIVLINRIVLQLINHVCKWYEKPDITTLSFDISFPSQSQTIIVSGVWNGANFNLTKLSHLIKELEKEQHKKIDLHFEEIEGLSINKWFDIDAF